MVSTKGKVKYSTDGLHWQSRHPLDKHFRETKQNMDKIDEILSRFPNEAREMYRISPLLHNAVHAIANGADPYTLLYDTIKACDKISQEFASYAKGDTRPPQYILTTQERIDEIKRTGKLT